MIEYDATFWQAYYRWSIMSPLDRAMEGMADSFLSIQLLLLDHLTPAFRKATWVFEDFAFALSLADMDRWERVAARLWYSFHRMARRFR